MYIYFQKKMFYFCYTLQLQIPLGHGHAQDLEDIKAIVAVPTRSWPVQDVSHAKFCFVSFSLSIF